MLRADFTYDARAQVLFHSFIHDSANLADVLSLRALGRDVLDFNRPVNQLTLMLDAALWGQNPLSYHLTNILLHAATVVMLFLFVRSLLLPSPLAGEGRLRGTRTESLHDARAGASWPAFAGALLFAVHPRPSQWR